MESVSKQSGRTILFVSHNMAAISSLCTRSILLDHGKIIYDGSTQDGINSYINLNLENLRTKLVDRKDRSGEGNIIFVETWTEDHIKNKKSLFLSGETLVIAIKFKRIYKFKYKQISAAFALKDYQDYQITDLNSVSSSSILSYNSMEYQIIRCKINQLPLTNGNYNYNAILRTDNIVQDFILNVGSFQVEEGDFFKTGKTIEKGQGIILMNQNWELCAE